MTVEVHPSYPKTKIYVVTSGVYSDYTIDAVFTDVELANNYVEKHNQANWNEAKIEEWTANEVKDPILYSVVTMNENGDSKVRLSFIESETDKTFGFMFTTTWGTPGIVWHLNTLDEKRAVKAVNEKRTIILSHGIWGQDEKIRELFYHGSPTTARKEDDK